MRYFTIFFVSLFLAFTLVGCESSKPPTKSKKPSLDLSRLKEVQKEIYEKKERRRQEEAERQREAEAEQQQKISTLIKKYSLEEKDAPALAELAQKAKEGSDIWTALDQTVRRKAPDYLLTLPLEQLTQMADGDKAKEDRYFGPFSDLNKEWLKAVKEKKEGSEFLLSLYLRISADWLGDPKCGELKRAALDGFVQKLKSSPIEENVSEIDRLITDNQEVIETMRWKRVELIVITAETVMSQLNQLPEQDPKVLWHYLEALKKADLGNSGLYQEAKEILRRNNFNLEDEVRLSNL